ncbi:conjugal transfer protein TraG N-terminal domain-containing protein [Klebsiella pneumoniae]|uniref:conjugal transfer protein TraG N-terminal domain-containing protein n=1 Tax=Klebsiella pneumoniae TaxID=573 RepID=UPI0039770A7D
MSQNPQITTLFSDYVQNCVMGDIFLNHKYSFEELLNSPDPYTLIFANPSPLRGVFDKNNQFQTCEEASRDLKSALALDTQTGGKTWNYYVRQLFGGKPNPDLLFSQMIGDSYNYFYSSGQSAGQIIRQNVTMNALRSGIQSYAARSGDTASLVNMANTSSLEKQRLAQATMGHQALRALPLMQTVIMGLMIGMFPIMVMAAMFNMMTLQVLKGYVFALIWLQTWPLLFAILNSAMAYYAKQNGVPVVLSELSQVQLKNSDIATTAGYIAVMIPPLSWGIVKSMGLPSPVPTAIFLLRGSVQHRRRPPAWWTGITLSPTCRWRTSAATAGVPTVQPVSDRCRGSWRMGYEHADAGWIDGLGQWWCNVKTAGGYQRRSPDSQCAATDGP